ARVDLASEGLPELEADPGRALSGGERPQQLAQPLPVAAQTRDAIVVHGPARHVVGDEGIAVTVAADPRPELEKWRHLELSLRIGLAQRALELVHEVRDEVEQVLRPDVTTPGERLGARGH